MTTQPVKLTKPKKPVFAVGDNVQYWNHVADYNIATLQVQSVDDAHVTAASKYFNNGEAYTFRLDGIATWSGNLSIKRP